jgi:hypothetical protein
MSKRSKWVEFDKETRKYIKKRDNNKCVLCGSTEGLQIMHIFMSRAKGGHGCKENGCLGCIKCHQIMDNPIGEQQKKLSDKFLNDCKNYLKLKENLIIDNKFMDKLHYKPIYQPIILNQNKNEDHCKNCIYIRKNKLINSTIPVYYCLKQNKTINKRACACNLFKTMLK